jgi:FkbM family methyltransferase
MAKVDLARTGKQTLERGLAKMGLKVGRFPDSLGPGYHLSRLLDIHGVDCVLDVGANEGQFAAMLRGSGFRGPIISFEPLAEAYRTLQTRAATDPFWATRQLALGDEPGTRGLNVTTASTLSSFLKPRGWWREEWAGAQIRRTDEIEVVPLDNLASEMPYRRMFLKVDTQGYDLRVLAGASGVLDRIVGIQVELSCVALYEGAPDYLEMFRAVRDLGFTPSAIFPVLADERLRAIELDGVFVRA